MLTISRPVGVLSNGLIVLLQQWGANLGVFYVCEASPETRCEMNLSRKTRLVSDRVDSAKARGFQECWKGCAAKYARKTQGRKQGGDEAQRHRDTIKKRESKNPRSNRECAC